MYTQVQQRYCRPRIEQHDDDGRGDQFGCRPSVPSFLPSPSSAPTPIAITANSLREKQQAAPGSLRTSTALPVVDPRDVLLCDLGSKSLLVEDLENALRLWTRPAVVIVARNSLDRLPSNVPSTILFLDLSRNRLTLLNGLAAMPHLRELDVSHNGVENMLGLASNVDLRVLRMSHNCIRRIEGLHQLKRLEEADFSYNLIRTREDMRALSLNAALRRLRIEGNPYCTTGVHSRGHQISMHHLLPGMSLLDGRSTSGLPARAQSALLPPPPPLASDMDDHHHHRAGHSAFAVPCGRSEFLASPHHASAKERPTSHHIAQDISVSRKWREAIHPTTHLVEHPHQQRRWFSAQESVSRTRSPPRITVTTGGGGPVVDPGSYVQMFRATQERGCANNVSTVEVPKAAVTFSPSHEATTERRMRGKAWAQRGHTSERATALKNANGVASAQGLHDGHDNEAKGKHCQDGASGKHRQGGREVGIHPTQSSLLAYRGLSRSERGAARRRAWSEARREGVVRDGTTHQQQQERQRQGPAEGQQQRCTLTKSATSSFESISLHNAGTTFRSGGGRRITGARPSAAREGPIVKDLRGAATSMEVPPNTKVLGGVRQPQKSLRTIGSAARDPFETGAHGDGESLTDRSVGPRQRVRGGRAKPGAKRLIGALREAVKRESVSAARKRINSRPRRTATAGCRVARRGYGGGRGTRESEVDTLRRRTGNAKGTDGAVPGASERCDHYRFKTTLGQRNRRTARPLAPSASPWTPRDDAAPRLDGSQRNGLAEHNDAKSVTMIGRVAAMAAHPSSWERPSYVPVEAKPARGQHDSSSRVGTLRQGVGGEKAQHTHHRDYQNIIEQTSSLSSGDIDCATRDRSGLFTEGEGERLWTARPFVSPLSRAGILRRASSATSGAEYGGGGSFQSAPLVSPGVTTRQTVATDRQLKTHCGLRLRGGSHRRDQRRPFPHRYQEDEDEDADEDEENEEEEYKEEEEDGEEREETGPKFHFGGRGGGSGSGYGEYGESMEMQATESVPPLRYWQRAAWQPHAIKRCTDDDSDRYRVNPQYDGRLEDGRGPKNEMAGMGDAWSEPDESPLLYRPPTEVPPSSFPATSLLSTTSEVKHAEIVVTLDEGGDDVRYPKAVALPTSNSLDSCGRREQQLHVEADDDRSSEDGDGEHRRVSEDSGSAIDCVDDDHDSYSRSTFRATTGGRSPEQRNHAVSPLPAMERTATSLEKTQTSHANSTNGTSNGEVAGSETAIVVSCGVRRGEVQLEEPNDQECVTASTDRRRRSTTNGNDGIKPAIVVGANEAATVTVALATSVTLDEERKAGEVIAANLASTIGRTRADERLKSESLECDRDDTAENEDDPISDARVYAKEKRVEGPSTDIEDPLSISFTSAASFVKSRQQRQRGADGSTAGAGEEGSAGAIDFENELFGIFASIVRKVDAEIGSTDT